MRSVAWPQGLFLERSTSRQVNSFEASWLFIYTHFLSSKAGLRPAVTAATIMAGLAGAWSYVKNAVTKRSFAPADPENKEHSIPMAELTREDPILFYAEVPLYEDELHDNGSSSVLVRVVRLFMLIIFAQLIRIL